MNSKNLLLAASAMALVCATAQPGFAQAAGDQVAAADPAATPVKKAKKAKKEDVAAAAPAKAQPAKPVPPVVGPTVSERAEIEALRKQVMELGEQLNDIRTRTSTKFVKLEADTAAAAAAKAAEEEAKQTNGDEVSKRNKAIELRKIAEKELEDARHALANVAAAASAAAAVGNPVEATSA